MTEQEFINTLKEYGKNSFDAGYHCFLCEKPVVHYKIYDEYIDAKKESERLMKLLLEEYYDLTELSKKRARTDTSGNP